LLIEEIPTRASLETVLSSNDTRAASQALIATAEQLRLS
jgi:hypothetical protein